MNEELKRIHERLMECKLGETVRVSLLNPNSDAQFLTCFLLLNDRFTSFEDLLIAVRDCLNEIPVKIRVINESIITIMAG